MKRKVEIDLTALLDVILIILFAVMIQMNNATLQAKEETENLNQKNIQQQENLSALILENSLNRNQIDQLNEDITQLERILEDVQFEGNLDQYEVVMKKFVHVDLSVENVNEDVEKVMFLINGEKTGMHILANDWYDISLREGKINSIYELICAHLETVEGGTPLILINYQHDLEVYRYVSNVIEAAILKVQEHYGNETTLTTESIINKNKNN